MTARKLPELGPEGWSGPPTESDCQPSDVGGQLNRVPDSRFRTPSFALPLPPPELVCPCPQHRRLHSGPRGPLGNDTGSQRGGARRQAHPARLLLVCHSPAGSDLGLTLLFSAQGVVISVRSGCSSTLSSTGWPKQQTSTHLGAGWLRSRHQQAWRLQRGHFSSRLAWRRAGREARSPVSS